MSMKEMIYGDVVVLSVSGNMLGDSETVTLRERVKALVAEGFLKIVLDLTHDNARSEQTAAGFQNDLVLILDDARHAQPTRQGQPMNPTTSGWIFSSARSTCRANCTVAWASAYDASGSPM